MCKIWLSCRHYNRTYNDILCLFPEYFNPLPAFKMWYSEIIQIIYYMVKEVRFSVHDIMEELFFYDVYYLFDMWQKEVEERNKQQKEENDKMDGQMAEMRRSMSHNMNQNNTNSISMPQMSGLPKF